MLLLVRGFVRPCVCERVHVLSSHALPACLSPSCAVLSSCPAGRYGHTSGINLATCSGLCTAGFYCPAGSTSATASPCGGSSVYCPSGASLPINVSAGYYSVGTVGQRSDQQQCAPGSYCVGGVSIPCPVATFSNTSGATVCAGVCAAGYSCAPGSSSGTSQECVAGAYCPGGDPAAPILCPVGRYRSSTKGAALEDCTLCPSGTYSNRTGEVAVEGCVPCAPLEGSSPGSSVCWPGLCRWAEVCWGVCWVGRRRSA